MIVSWNWLKEYVNLSMNADELTERLTLTGLNLEGVSSAGDDTAIDLEVTSNRPDCLGHIGVAREVAILWDGKLQIPGAKPQATGPKIESLASVAVDLRVGQVVDVPNYVVTAVLNMDVFDK